MRKYLFLLLFTVSLSFVFPKNILADLYSPAVSDKCMENEIFFPPDIINPSLYKKITYVQLDRVDRIMQRGGDREFGDGYCVDKIEYCSKSNCLADILVGAPAFGSSGLVLVYHIRNIIINLVINTLLIFLMHVANDLSVKKYKPLKAALLTVLGYIYDRVAYPIAFAGTTATYNARDPVVAIAILLLIVASLVGITFYFVYSKHINEGKITRIVSSVIFAFASNPAWIYFINLYS